MFMMVGHLTVYLLVLFLLLMVLLFWRKQLQLAKIANISGPMTLPFIGSSYQLIGGDLSDTFRRLREIRRKYGNTVRLSFGNHLIIIVTEPDSIERVIANKALVDRIELAKLMLRDTFRNGILINSGDTWRVHRKLLSALFHNSYLENFAKIFSKNATLLADNIAKIPKETTFDTYSYAILCTIDIITETVIGGTGNFQATMNTSFADTYSYVLHCIGERVRSPWLYIDFLYKKTEQWKKMKKRIDVIYEHVENLLKERKEKYKESTKNGEVNKEFYIFEVLMESGEVSEKEMVEECFNMMTAGSETTATVFAFTLAALGEHQDVQEKAMEEQLNIFHDDLNRPVTYDDLQKMTYLDQVRIYI